MPGLTPKSIFNEFTQKKISRSSAIEKFISLIENSESITTRIESINYLGELNYTNEEIYSLLENLFISDSYEKIRIAAAHILRASYLEKSLQPMRWALEHEESNAVLTSIFETLMELIENLKEKKDSYSKIIIVEELKKIEQKEFKICFESIYEKEPDISLDSLAEILINYFSIVYLKKTFWRIKYSIDNCLIISLSFKFKGLTQIPLPIKYLLALRKLKFRYNQIMNLPDWIGSLNSLQTLNLNMNNLNELPISIGKLSSLKKFDLWKNEIKTLPDSIGSLSRLEKLNLRINHLLELPETIGNLKSLKHLDLHDNNLKTIPESLSNLKNLQILNLSWNELAAIPESISNLQALRVLDLGGNELIHIPPSIGNLKSLEYLNLSRNELETLPNSLSNLTNLKELYIGENKIKKIPKALKDLEAKNVKIYFNSCR
ncbi:MAG: leucine-rich repeat domain-containing protein [Promethearchaeota archaeon]